MQKQDIEGLRSKVGPLNCYSNSTTKSQLAAELGPAQSQLVLVIFGSIINVIYVMISVHILLNNFRGGGSGP